MPKKITDLTLAQQVARDDVFPFVDVANGVTKKATAIQIATVLPRSVPFEHYGAVGDGTTDNAAALERFRAAAAGAAAGGRPIVLELGCGNYFVASGSYAIPRGGIVGCGPASVLSFAHDTTLLQINENGTLLSSFRIEGRNAKSSQVAVQLGAPNVATMPTNVSVRDVEVENVYCGFRCTSGDSSQWRGPQFTGCRAIGCNVGFGVYEQAEYVCFTGCQAWGSLIDRREPGIGLDVRAGNVCWVGGNLSRNIYGVYLGTGPNDAHGVVSGATVNHNASSVHADAVLYGFTFNGCHFYGGECWLDGARGITFSNCTCNFDSGSGLFLTRGATANRVYDCIFPTDIEVSIDAGSQCYFKNARMRDSNDVPSKIAGHIQRSFTFASDADQTLTLQESTCDELILNAGVVTAPRQITVNQSASGARSRRILVVNENAHEISVRWSSGRAVGVPAGGSRYVGSDGTNARLHNMG